ncbi:hypothetical protein [Biomaibacter acetigenes]|jgi:hypothetical protein|nr:hypothetical protein [Biomaibacter acetigenes]
MTLFDVGILPSTHAMIAKTSPEENRGSVYGVASGITELIVDNCG